MAESTLEYKDRPSRALLLAGVGLVFLLIGLAMTQDPGVRWAGIGVAVFGGVVLVVGLTQALKPLTLRVEPDRVVASQSYRKDLEVRFEHVEQFVPVPLPQGAGTMIGYRLRASAPPVAGSSASNAVAGVDGALPSTSAYGHKKDPAPLVAELNRRLPHPPPTGEAGVGPYDDEALARWMVERVEDLSDSEARTIIALWHEHLAAIGAAPAESVAGRWYEPGSLSGRFGRPGIADPDKVADDAPELIGVPRERVAAALAVEFDYLRHLGLAD
jgi:hypothetical protein